MGMLIWLLGSLSIDEWLCACVRSAVGGGLVKGGCVVDVVCVFNQVHAPSLRARKRKRKPQKQTNKIFFSFIKNIFCIFFLGSCVDGLVWCSLRHDGLVWCSRRHDGLKGCHLFGQKNTPYLLFNWAKNTLICHLIRQTTHLICHLICQKHTLSAISLGKKQSLSVI